MDAEHLQEVLTSRSMTHQDLAEKLGVTRAAVTQWCGGAVRPLGPTRRLLALVLGVPLSVVNAMFDRVADGGGAGDSEPGGGTGQPGDSPAPAAVDAIPAPAAVAVGR